MLIEFETRSRWRITISSPHHGVAEHSAQPGACPFVSASGEHSCFFLTNPSPRRHPKGTFEDTFPLRNEEQNQRRRNGLWNFCKRLIGIREMHPPRYPPIAPEKPMPSDVRRYDTSYMGEFSNGTIAELPVMPAELESHQQKGSDYPYNTGDMGVGYPYHEQFMGLEHTVPRTLEYTNTTRLPLSLDIQQSFSSVPSLMSGHPSHISSPVSSLDTNIVEDLQLGSHGDFRRKSESFINAHSPSRQSWAGTNGIGMGLNGAWQDDRALLATMNRTQASFASAGGSPSSNPAFRRDSHIEHTSWPHSDGAPICDAGSTSSPSMQRSTGSALPQSRGLESILLGVYEQESEHVWRHSPLDGTERQNVKITNRPTIGLSPSQSPSQASQFDGQQQLETYAEHHDHTYPEVVEEVQCECSQCGKIFHGKYCDTNMRRHVRVIHKCIGRTKCSMCERWFRRSDAARKHEWDRHGLSSAKPKTRANS